MPPIVERNILNCLLTYQIALITWLSKEDLDLSVQNATIVFQWRLHWTDTWSNIARIECWRQIFCDIVNKEYLLKILVPCLFLKVMNMSRIDPNSLHFCVKLPICRIWWIFMNSYTENDKFCHFLRLQKLAFVHFEQM